MADQPPLNALRAALATPIAQLNPEITDTKSRVVDGVVTITWPYSTVTKSIAFILAEHDILIRRNRGQIRVELYGTSGEAFADANIGGGDQLRISLDGAQWTDNDAKTGLPAGSLEWQLNFTNRLLLSIRRVESEDPELIDVNAPRDLVDGALEPRPDPRVTPPPGSVRVQDQEETSTPFAQSFHSSVLKKRLASNTFEPEEYASPAFIKRARVSYGSLFEGELDLFGDDKGKNKKSRRKSRFSMGNAEWKYSSRSPSPETMELSESESPENESTEEMRATADSSQIKPTSQRSLMVDEGCQTQEEYDFSSSMHVQVLAEAHVQEPELAASSTPGLFAGKDQSLHTPSRNLFGHSQLHSEMSDIATEPLNSHVATSQLDPSFSLELSTTHAEMARNAFGTVSAPPELMGSHERLVETTVAPSYPDFTTTDQVYAEPMMHHDQNLHFQEHDIHSTNHAYQNVSQRDSPTWHPAVVSSYPPVPSERQEPQTAVIIGSSPPPTVEAGRDTELRTSQTPQEEDDKASRDQDASPVEGQASTLGQERSDSEDDGGDIKGEDYDLRNYAHAQDDDDNNNDDESVSEDDSDASGSDVEGQAMYSSADGDTSEEEREGVEEANGVGIAQHRGFPDRELKEFAASENDESEVEEDEEQYYDEEGTDEETGYLEDEGVEEEYDEEDYDEEDYDEEEEDAVDEPPAPSNPREPVCIDLISDSEDEKDEEPPNEEPEDVVPREQDQQEDDTPPSEADATERAIEEPTTTRHSGDGEIEKEGHEESGPMANEVNEGEPIQPSTALEDAEAVGDTEKQEEHDKMDVDEATSEPVSHNVVEEITMPDTVAQQAAKDGTQEKARHGEEIVKASHVEDAEDEIPSNGADTSEERPAVQEPSTNEADVKMAEPAPAADIQRPAAKLDEPAVGQEPEQQTDKGEAAKRVQLPTPMDTQAPEKTTEHLPAQEQEEDDDSAAAEDQIMKEYREYQSPTHKGSTARIGPGTEAASEAPGQTQSRESDILIATARSLRNRRQSHQKTQSTDSTSSAPKDPSVLLAQASTPVHSDEAEPEPELANEPSWPAALRIMRNTKPDQPDPTILLARSCMEPSKSDETPGPTVRVTRSMTGHSEEPSSPVGIRTSRRLATPETQTTHRDDQVLVSPSISGSFVEDEPLSALKRQLQKDLRTKLPDYVPLRSLRTSLNKTVDVLAVATSTPPQPHRPKHGPRDYMLELTLIEPSSAPTAVSVAHLFRPHQASLPVIHKGDVVLLRRVTVVSMKGRGFGFRVSDASAWAVFEMGDDEMLPQIKGPPVEVSTEEVEYAGGLRKWWAVLDQAARGKIDKATQKVVGKSGE